MGFNSGFKGLNQSQNFTDKGCTYTHWDYVNTYCFSTATMVVRTRLNVTLYAHWLSYFSQIFRCPKIVAKRRKVSFKTKTGAENKAGSRLPVPLACGYSGRVKAPSLWAVAALTHASSHLTSIMLGMTNSWARLNSRGHRTRSASRDYKQDTAHK